MEPGSTVSKRSSFESESTLYDDTLAQTRDIESARPLIRPSESDGARNGKPDGRRPSKPRRPAGASGQNEVLLVKGVRVGRGTILCGVLLTFLA